MLNATAELAIARPEAPQLVLATSIGAALVVVVATVRPTHPGRRPRSAAGRAVEDLCGSLLAVGAFGVAVGITVALAVPLWSQVPGRESTLDASFYQGGVSAGVFVISVYALGWPAAVVSPRRRVASLRARVALAGTGLVWWACVTALVFGAAAAYVPGLQYWRAAPSLLYMLTGTVGPLLGAFIALMRSLLVRAARSRAQAFTSLDQQRATGLWRWDGQRWWPLSPPWRTEVRPRRRRSPRSGIASWRR